MEKIININTQKDLDNLFSKNKSEIEQYILDKTITELTFNFTSSDVFYYDNNLFNFVNINRPDLVINIFGCYDSKGNYTKLVAKGSNILTDNITELFNVLKYSRFCITYYNLTYKKYNFIVKFFRWILRKKKEIVSSFNATSLWQNKFYDTDQLIDVDKFTKLCKIKYNDNSIFDNVIPKDILNNEEALDTYIKENKIYIHVLQWYKSSYYEVRSIDVKSKLIEFYCNDLSYDDSKKHYTINSDYSFSKGKYFSKFRLSTLPQISKLVDNVYVSKKTKFITVLSSKFNSIDIAHIEFIGNAFTNSTDALINVAKSEFENDIKIRNCKFYDIYSDVARITDTKNISIFNNEFEKCWRYCLYINDTYNASVYKNSFTNIGLEVTNTSGIRIDGDNYNVAENVLINFGYNGIGCGTWWRTEEKIPAVGTIYNNILTYKNGYSTPLMDSGAIYLWSQHGNTVIKHNTIKNYIGRYLNRSIFCDDGANNFTLDSNIIYGGNKDEFCIDARRVKTSDTSSLSKMAMPANVNCHMFNNVVSGPLKLEGNEDYVNDDKYKCTIKLHESSNKYKNVINNVTILN